jgi:hypothetical protein
MQRNEYSKATTALKMIITPIVQHALTQIVPVLAPSQPAAPSPAPAPNQSALLSAAATGVVHPKGKKEDEASQAALMDVEGAVADTSDSITASGQATASQAQGQTLITSTTAGQDKATQSHLALLEKVVNQLVGADGIEGCVLPESMALFFLVFCLFVLLNSVPSCFVFSHPGVCTDNSLAIELLNLCSILVRCTASQLVSDARKQLIKFAWVYLKNDDITVSQSAYAFVCSFIRGIKIGRVSCLFVIVIFLDVSVRLVFALTRSLRDPFEDHSANLCSASEGASAGGEGLGA